MRDKCGLQNDKGFVRSSKNGRDTRVTKGRDFTEGGVNMDTLKSFLWRKSFKRNSGGSI